MGSYAFSNRKSTYQNQWCRSFLFCSSATNRLITSKDHASVQINVRKWSIYWSIFHLCTLQFRESPGLSIFFFNFTIKILFYNVGTIYYYDASYKTLWVIFFIFTCMDQNCH
ncbi:putative ribosomal protein S21e [Helianthus anomalus]